MLRVKLEVIAYLILGYFSILFLQLRTINNQIVNFLCLSESFTHCATHLHCFCLNKAWIQGTDKNVSVTFHSYESHVWQISSSTVNLLCSNANRTHQICIMTRSQVTSFKTFLFIVFRRNNIWVKNSSFKNYFIYQLASFSVAMFYSFYNTW